MRIRSAWVACALALAGAGTGTGTGAAQQDTSIELLEEAAARYEQVRTLCADFEQTLTVPLLRQERTGRGRLCQAQPDLFAMRFTEPENDRVIADGEWLWVYQPSVDDKTVLRGAMTMGAGGYDIHREFLHDPGTKYDATYQGEDAVGSRPAHRIRLVPKQPVSYRSAVIWLDRGTLALRRIRIEDENGSVRTLTLESIETDGPVPPAWFEFDRPPGVQVITR